MKGLKVYHLLVLVVMALCLVSTQANAQVTYYFGSDSTFGTPPQWGGVAPTGTWATAEFIDLGTDNVQLTLNVTNNLNPTEFIGEFYFNSIMSTSLLTFTAQAGGGSYADIQKGNNSYQADGDGLYDLLFDFPPFPGPGADKNAFTAGEFVIYNITGTGVSASNFYDISVPGTGSNGPFYAAAKLQGIDCDEVNYSECAAQGGTTSAWSAGVVPEPISSTLFLVGAATLGYRRFRKNKNKTIA